MEQLELPFMYRRLKIFEVYQSPRETIDEDNDYQSHVMYVCGQDMLGAEWEASFHFPRWRFHCKIRPVSLEAVEKKLKIFKRQAVNTEAIINKVREEYESNRNS